MVESHDCQFWDRNLLHPQVVENYDPLAIHPQLQYFRNLHTVHLLVA